MTEQIPAPSRRAAAVRLGVLVLFLAVLFYLVAVRQAIDIEAVRELVRAAGPVAPLVFVPVSALLAAIFVPGTLLAATSGLLFGPLVGTVVTLFSAVGTAMITSLLGRRAGRASARGLIGAERSDRIDAQIARGGLWAVVGQRFVPGISDALASYVFGAFGVPLWQMVAGSFIGSAPRAFVYTALGASIGEFSAPLAYTAIGVWCVTAVLGVFAAHRGYRMWRHRPRPEPAAEPPVPS
ncbi:TVP38/TMEM64 family protein [Nocardia asteroides]|uniref:TVP38/TMEM64 family protein n=1 Tax=Nocardia asteroides TaxID=1824 RepID=UPI001E426DFD|nr:TVP38/TMEM64 family protein [Nocardia asteroides]UGT63516.1 TVP38/TMEM64 family protein [Nocardia asteroides]